MRPIGNPVLHEKRRLDAVHLVVRGDISQTQAAKQHGVHPRTVRYWMELYRKQGAKGLKATPNLGRPPRLSVREKTKLRNWLLKGAKACDFSTDLWTCSRVALLIRKRFGHHYHISQVSRILHALGFSPQKPQRKAIERDEIQIKNWRTRVWPRIKKKPGN